MLIMMRAPPPPPPPPPLHTENARYLVLMMDRPYEWIKHCILSPVALVYPSIPPPGIQPQDPFRLLPDTCYLNPQWAGGSAQGCSPHT